MLGQLKDLSRLNQADLIVRGGLIWPGPGREPLTDCGVVVRDGRVVELAPWPELRRREGKAEVVGGRDRLVMPGLINGHTHLPMVLFRGLADDLPLMDWLEKHIWPAEAAQVNPEMVELCGRLALAEAIRSGTTTVVDSYFGQIGAIKAAAQAGIRAVLAQGIIDFPAPGVPDPSRNIAVAEEFLESDNPAPDRIDLALFCHAPYSCGPETIRRTKELGRRRRTQTYIHLAEGPTENPLMLDRHDCRSVAYLDRLGFLDNDTVAVHCVHLEPDEISLLAERGVGVISCPESNQKLASGRADVAAWLEAGLKVGLGTDGAASNNDLNMFDEIGSLARWHKGAALDPTVLPAPTVLDLATAAGGEAIGRPGLGLIEPGAPADLITLDLDRPHLMPLYSLAAQLVYAADGSEVMDSVIDGRVVMADRELKTLDWRRDRDEVIKLAKAGPSA